MLMCASLSLMVSYHLKVPDPCNHFKGKKVQVVFIHHIQPQIVGLGADPAAHNTSNITCVTNTLEGRWQGGWAIAMGAGVPCPHPRQTLSPAPHNRLPPRPQVHQTTMLVQGGHPHPMNSQPRLSEATEGMGNQCPPKCPHIR